ncbi:MAG: hypothetical protein IJU36_04080 [Paludibacteraceae bacterium]|nr:hypothetical protein [Paludibacteraceae bacterium]
MEIKELLEFTSRAQLRAWLEANHTSAKECWVTTYRTKVPREDAYHTCMWSKRHSVLAG